MSLDWKTRGMAMSAIEITRRDLTAAELRRAAGRERNARASRRMLALALVLDGANRTTAARSCGMDRQTLRDWVHRYNEEGLAGLAGRKHTGRPPKLTAAQKEQFLAWVEAGPAASGRKIVRWRCKDLGEELAARFGVVLHERTVGKLLNALGYRRLSARPQHPKANEEAQEAFKKTSARTPPERSRIRPKESPSKSGSRTKRALANRAR
jgi:transposase